MQTCEADGEKKLIRNDIKEMTHGVGMLFVCWVDSDANRKAQSKDNECEGEGDGEGHQCFVLQMAHV